jgi:hemerythrin superfamily protein
MNGIDVLKDDHRRVEQLFAEFIQIEDSEDERERLFQRILTELSAHVAAEEKVFYPALQAEIPDQIDQARAEHSQVKQMLAQLLEMDFEDDDFDAKFTGMMKAVQQHVEEEEGPGGIMDVAQQELSAEILTTMATDIETVEQEIQADMAA